MIFKLRQAVLWATALSLAVLAVSIFIQPEVSQAWPPAWSLRFLPGLLACSLALYAIGESTLSTRTRAALRLMAYGCLIASIWPAVDNIIEWSMAITNENWPRYSSASPVAKSLAFANLFITVLNNNWQWSLSYLISFLVPLLAVAGLLSSSYRTLMALLGSDPRAKQHGPWTGGWLDRSKVAALGRNQSGLSLGIKDRRILRYKPDLQIFTQGHHMVVAGTRSGKGVSTIIPAIIDHDGPIAAIDIKGELFAVVSEHRSTLGRRQIILNPYKIIRSVGDRYNPLSYIRAEQRERDIKILSDGLITPEASKEHEWISRAARQLVEATLHVLLEVGDTKDQNLKGLAELLLNPGLEETLQAWTEAPSLAGGAPARAAANFLGMGDRQRGTVLSSLAENLEWLNLSPIRELFSGSDFSLEEILDDQIDIYLIIPQDLAKDHGRFFRLMMNLLLGTVLRQDGYRTINKPILTVFDEFTRLGKMEKVLDIATIAAGAGIEALFVIQDRGSLDEVYSEKGAASLIASCATVRAFGLGRLDNLTADWLVGALTNKTLTTESTSHKSGSSEGPQKGKAEHKEKLLTAGQILELGPDQMICFLKNHAPVQLKRIVSHKHPAYKGKLDKNPTLRA
jgi:type IV secretion system protein VirD4